MHPDVHVDAETGEMGLQHQLPHQRILRDVVLSLFRECREAFARGVIDAVGDQVRVPAFTIRPVLLALLF